MVLVLVACLVLPFGGRLPAEGEVRCKKTGEGRSKIVEWKERKEKAAEDGENREKKERANMHDGTQ